MSDHLPARLPSEGTLRDLGPLTWVFCKLAARRQRIPRVRLFTTLGLHSPLLWTWLPHSGYLLFVGKLSRKDAEVVILRVAHLRNNEYELQQHRRLARTRGLGPEIQAKIFEGPDADGLTDRQRALITATDEFVVTRGVSPETWATLASHLNRAQLIEFCFLAAQYDGLAATITTLNIPLDYPD
ncbi:carboxymuconolactone decarboxylase family protein [Mycolicibacterium sp. 120270]|uniref:carboxymuconolactone decarboxylase family protein n=1 Tax=Mycolicibacterium sp. 120270 TaxID=3090600 RepID=UPI00299DC45B|nr:carboxymuconolactone decarboxylase family protein [Mycolicibacterium sp. 120270]MDX1883498.1 carboxymuconolactone decarboxylase family protein [Mycolicibacterium sp. 120270]